MRARCGAAGRRNCCDYSDDHHLSSQKLECGPFFIHREEHSGKAHGGQFGLLDGMLWSIAKKLEDMD